MSEKYKIGEYEFDTYEDYLAGQEDVKKIDFITKEMDITDADVAVRLYTLIRNKEIVFHSKVGISFTWYLTDLLVQNSKKLLEEKQKKEEQRQQGRKIWAAGIGCIAAAAVFLGIYIGTLVQDYRKHEEYERLKDMQNMTGQQIQDPFVDNKKSTSVADGEDAARSEGQEDGSDSQTEGSNAQAEEVKINPADLTVLKEYKKLFKKNKDLAGWLTIEGTDIDYPVMQTDVEHPDYYLHHNFDKEEDDAGSLFLDARNDFVNRDTNLIIYGHNMRNGTMFGSLQKYMEKDFFEEHKKIRFDTIYEKVHYSIVAVCLSKVNYEDDYTFRYYNFINAGNKDDFNAYLANIQQLTVFDQKIDISYGDELLTLSTCNNYTEDGRLFLVAKKENGT